MITFYGYEKGKEIYTTALRIPKQELEAAVGGISLFSDSSVFSQLAWFQADKHRSNDFEKAKKLGKRPDLSFEKVYGQHILSGYDSPISNRGAAGILVVDSLDKFSQHLYGKPFREVAPGSEPELDHGDGQIPVLGRYVLAQLDGLHYPAQRVAWGLAFNKDSFDIKAYKSEREAYQALRP